MSEFVECSMLVGSSGAERFLPGYWGVGTAVCQEKKNWLWNSTSLAGIRHASRKTRRNEGSETRVVMRYAFPALGNDNSGGAFDIEGSVVYKGILECSPAQKFPGAR